MPNDDDTRAQNVALMVDDLVQLCRSWRLRGFDPNAMIAALGTGALTAMTGAGLSRDQVVGIVDHHFGNGAHHKRPTVQA